MTRQLPWLSPLVVALAAQLGCTDSPAPAGSTASENTGDDGTPGTGATGELGTSVVSGRVQDLAGTAVTDLFVTVSDEYCVPDQTSATGAFEVTRVTDGPMRFLTYGETAQDGPFASVVFPIVVEGDTELATPVTIPRLAQRFPVDEEATEVVVIETDEGLRLEIQPGSLELAPFFEHEVLAAAVPLDHTPPFVPEGVQLQALFVLHPIRSTLDPPAALHFPPDMSLSPGAAVTFHALDYDTGTLLPVASGTVDMDGSPTTDPGEGIPELTWIGVSVDS